MTPLASAPYTYYIGVTSFQDLIFTLATPSPAYCTLTHTTEVVPPIAGITYNGDTDPKWIINFSDVSFAGQYNFVYKAEDSSGNDHDSTWGFILNAIDPCPDMVINIIHPMFSSGNTISYEIF